MEKNKLYKFKNINMNRHTNFIFEKDIFLFGGFNQKNPLPLGDMYKISLDFLFENSNLKSILSTNKNSDLNKENNDKEKINYLLSNEVVIGSDKKVPSNNKKDELDELSLFTKLSISKLNDENKRLGYMGSENALLSKKNTYNRKLIEKFLDTLLRPNDWFDKKVMAELAQKLPFKLEEILYLIDEVTKIVEKENSLIKIRSPCKIFGNIYGVYTDLMRYFESYGNPSDNIQNGDINVMQYIFLGDFCDRGNQSLEVILLLFALKVKYPDFIYLIRGHHEDKAINEFYGLGKECTEKLKEDIKNEESVFNKINQVFDLLPFGVLVDNTILCIHGGIGASIKSLDDISNIPRPTKIYQNPESYAQMNILDLLYSEYDNEEDDESYSVNTLRDKNQKGFIVNYGKKRLDEFMQGNNINLIIAAHKFVKEGFCTYCDDKLLNLFSCTNYMDKNNNVGAMIIIGKKAKNKNANIMPKLLGVNENKNKNSQFRKDKSPSPLKIK
jgi:protein phosphatase